MRTLASPWSMFAALVLFAVSVPLCTGPSAGCATGGATDPDAQRVRQIIAYGALIALDIDDLKRDGATQAERDALQRHAGEAAMLVGINSEVGARIAELAATYAATGRLDEDAWRTAARILLEWAATPPPAPTP